MQFPDVFIDQASPMTMYDMAALNASDIEKKVLQVLGVDIINAKKA
jgi:1-deoxy-D-xylulose-5-phosphate synthase